MSVDATGILAAPKNTVADMLSRCATFQAEVGAPGDAVKAWAAIELTRWIIDESTLPPGGPFALVYLDEGFRMTRTSEGAAWNYQTNGAVMVYFRTDSPFQYATVRDQATAMENYVGAVMKELFDMSAVGGENLCIREIELTMEPQRVAKQMLFRRSYNWWDAQIRIDWGPD